MQGSALKVYWWKHPKAKFGNFGDEITPEIIERIWHIPCEWSPISGCQLVGAGSLIEKLERDNVPGHKIYVWGSGLMHTRRRPFINRDLTFLSVRGSLSRRRILSRRPFLSLGDPGLLASKVYDVERIRGSDVIGVLPHYVDLENSTIRALARLPNVKIIHPLQRPVDVAAEINTCKVILSSSLHGLIFADSYQIPNYRLKLGSNIYGGNFKFSDYFSSIGRKDTYLDSSAILNTNISDFAAKLESDYPVIDINTMQEKIINAFPVHLLK